MGSGGTRLRLRAARSATSAAPWHDAGSGYKELMTAARRCGAPRRPWPALVALGACAGACSGSVLVRPDDVTFARAQRRLTRTAAAVAAVAPPEPEQALFMQAEALYDYRFDPPARGVGNYLAQTIAVASEFAPLQALASSAGLFELRLRVHDGAVQLWEVLLARHPGTALRPLALYRLGWAYRSVGVGGLPRADGDHAFTELQERYPGSPLARLGLEARKVPKKSQDTAIGLSLVPGLGQMYAGEPLNGAVRLAAALACAALIVVPGYLLYRRVGDRDRLVLAEDWPYLATPFVGIILLNVAYNTAYQDAIRAAVQFNERAEETFEQRHPEAP
jgi:Tetratricopeptide repeat